jgi:mannose-6-phosphate isomerase-like protein (cupin superfamily)
VDERPKSVWGLADAKQERGSCGIRWRLLTGDEERHFAVSRVQIENAQPHYHERTWELYIVESGQGLLVLDGVEHPVQAGDMVEIPPGVVHRAVPQPSMTVLVVMSPPGGESGDLHCA